MIQNNSNLLINPSSMIQLEYTPPPLGLIFLAAMDNSTKIIDMALYPEFKIEQYIIENKPKVVGVPIYTVGRNESLKLLKIAKKHGAITVAGGPHVPLMYTMDWKPEEEYPYIDHFVIGDGEYAWEEITKNVDDRKGIIWKTNRKDLPDLNNLPLPAYEKTDHRKYPARTSCVKEWRGIDLTIEPRYSIVFGRGCLGKCSFCSTWWVNGPYRCHSIKWMEKHLMQLWDLGARHLTFQDDCLTADKQAFLELCKAMKKFNFVAYGTSRVDSVDDEIMEAAREAGFYEFSFGIEHGSQAMLNIMHKNSAIELSFKARESCKKAGIYFTALMMEGYPGETQKEIIENDTFLKKLNPDNIGSLGFTMILPGTSLYQKCKNANLIDDSFWLSESPYFNYAEGINNAIIKSEYLIEQQEFEEAKSILLNILKCDRNNVDALNDLGVIALLKNDIENAVKYLEKVLSVDRTNEIALENLQYLSENFKDKLLSLKIDNSDNHNLQESIPSIEFIKIDSFNDFVDYNNRMKNDYLARNKYEKSLLQDEQEFSVRGICISCKKEKDFLVDYLYSSETGEGRIPNWRERLVCPECQLNNRMRLSLHLIEELKHDLSNSKVYIAEQTTQTYRKLKNICKELVGSEYIGNSIPFGTTNNHGIRNEDFTNLTFANEEFDLVLSFDVFEHIYDYKATFAEAFRILKKGGSLLFTVPFDRNSEQNITRANLKKDGSIEHLLAPEYHGDPMKASEGCLCYFHFGWEMLNDLKEVGFSEAYSLFCYSKEYAYLGGDQVFFVATKSKADGKEEIESFQEKLNAQIKKAEEFIGLNQLHEAKEILETILLVEPNNIDSLIDLAIIEIMKNNFEEAKERLNIVLNVDPGNQIATENLIYLYEQIIANQKFKRNNKSSYDLNGSNFHNNKKTISVNLIILNEIDFIQNWLENTVPFADEIVIIDGGSTDGTIEKIVEFNSKKIKIYNWKQESSWYSEGWNESARRNLAIIQSTGDYILKKDVDEFFLEEDYMKMRELIEQDDDCIFCFPRLNFWGSMEYIRKNTEADPHWYPDYQGNLWNARSVSENRIENGEKK